MKINFQKNQRKKNKNAMNSFNISNATKTFKKLLEKNKKVNQINNKKNFYNKADEIFNSLNNIFFKEEIKETDFDYIFREIKKQIKINQHMVNLYGKNASNKSMPYSRDPVRFDKKLLFNPLKISDQKPIRYNSLNNKNEKILNLPCIFKKNSTISNRESSEKLLLIKNLESNKDFKDIIKGKKNINNKNNNNINMETDSSYFSNKNYSNTLNNERYVPIKTYNFFSKTNSKLLKVNKNKNKNSTFTIENKSSLKIGNKSCSFDRNEYILTLDNLKKQIRHKQRNQKIYFNSNDYGCELFKSKYNYITKNFFN